MEGFLKRTFIFVLLVECFVGITINLFIVAVYFMKWKAGKSLETCEKILICLGTSRSLSLIYSLMYYLVTNFTSTIGLYDFFSACLVIGMFLHLTNLWITTILCVFYCVKIINSSHKLFIFLKPKISRLVTHCMMASVLISLLLSLPAGWCIVHIQLQNSTDEAKNNMSTLNVMILNGNNRLAMSLVLFSFPSIIFCVSVCLLIHSLRMHSLQMRNSGTSFRNPNLEVHLNVVKSMVLFLLCQMLYITGEFFNASESQPRDSPWKAMISIIRNVSPFLHSAFIIASNSKLKETCLEMWRGVASQNVPRRQSSKNLN